MHDLSDSKNSLLSYHSQGESSQELEQTSLTHTVCRRTYIHHSLRTFALGPEIINLLDTIFMNVHSLYCIFDTTLEETEKFYESTG